MLSLEHPPLGGGMKKVGPRHGRLSPQFRTPQMPFKFIFLPVRLGLAHVTFFTSRVQRKRQIMEVILTSTRGPATFLSVFEENG